MAFSVKVETKTNEAFLPYLFSFYEWMELGMSQFICTANEAEKKFCFHLFYFSFSAHFIVVSCLSLLCCSILTFLQHFTTHICTLSAVEWCVLLSHSTFVSHFFPLFTSSHIHKKIYTIRATTKGIEMKATTRVVENFYNFYCHFYPHLSLV